MLGETNLSNHQDFRAVIGATGVILLVLGIIMMFSGVTLSWTETTNYYYSDTGLTYDIVTFDSTVDNGTTYTKLVEGKEFKATPVFPPGVSGQVSVWFPAETLSPAQAMALGASDPTDLGWIYMIFDMIVNWTVTGGTPTVYIYIQVPNVETKAYMWDGTQWVLFPTQEVVLIGGKAYLKLTVTQQLTGTLFTLTAPAPVGGELVEPGMSKTGLVLIAVGLALILTSIILYRLGLRERR